MLARLFLAIVLAAPALAGCVALPPTGDDRAERATGDLALACIDGVCNFEATLTPDTRQANELSVAVNPTNPLNIIATGKDYTPDEAGDCVWAGVYATLDGGLTWTNQNVPGSPWKRLQDPSTPVTPFSKFWCVTDPVVAFGPDGTAYWTVMPYQCDALSGSKTGRGVLPDGGFNDWLWTCSSMYVLVSEDGGVTWPVEKAREVAFGPRLEHDKQWIAVAPDANTVLLCWDRSAVKPTDSFTMVCSVSRDKGDTWSEVTPVGFAGWLPWIDFDAQGHAWMAALAGDDVIVSHSEDGLSWAEPVVVGQYEDPPPGGEYGWPVLRGSDFRMFAVPSLAVDRGTGPYAGSVYVTWFDHSKGEGETLLAASHDHGVTWGAPVRVNDDAGDHDQFMPAVSVGPDGTVDVSWYDRRDDPDNHVFHVYYAYSTDGGATFAPNLRVTDVPSDEQHSHHQNGMIFLGDYRDSDSVAGAATLVWTDTRHEKADVMVATVQRPGAA